jgi:hypothetical protein
MGSEGQGKGERELEGWVLKRSGHIEPDTFSYLFY